VELSETSQDSGEALEPRVGALAYVRALPRWEQIAVASLAALLAGSCFVRFGFSGRAAVDAFFAAVLVVLTAIDVDRRLLPNVIVLPAFAVVLAAQIALFPDRWKEWVFAALGAGLFFLVPILVYPAGMGMGDVKLAALLGAALGKGVISAVAAGLLAAAAVAVVILVREGRAGRKKAIPFGPFLALGALVALFVGAR
jgi:leader peptidase (prepilin peptidase)/N-methyltransferase